MLAMSAAFLYSCGGSGGNQQSSKADITQLTVTIELPTIPSALMEFLAQLSSQILKLFQKRLS